jgi:large subunit ribosomal protein L3
MPEEIKTTTEEKSTTPVKSAKPAPGILARKVGMTQIFDKDGNVIPVTVVEAGPCVVLQKKTIENDGYAALQLGFMPKKKANRPEAGHAKAAQKGVFKCVREFRLAKPDDFMVGEEIKVDAFKEGDVVDVAGISIGKGFAGTVKRHHFNRGPMSHGSKSHRLPGSIGAGTTPGRVFKGMRMSGRLGGKRVTVPKVEVVSVMPDKNLLLLSGTVPGKKNNFVWLRNRA